MDENTRHNIAAMDAVAVDPASSEPAEENPVVEEPEAQAALERALAELSQTRTELAKTREQLLRTAADFQNYRRRVEREQGQWKSAGKVELACSLLDVVDDLERTLEAADEMASRKPRSRKEAFGALRKGVELVYQKLMQVLAREGIERIEAVGTPFDEHMHEALMQRPAPEGVEPGTVVQELQRGYRMGERVLRHARVIVAS